MTFPKFPRALFNIPILRSLVPFACNGIVTNRFASLTPDQLAEALASTRPPTLVDVRLAPAFEAGRIPLSIHVPVYELGARRSELPGSLSARLVVIGDHQKRAHAAATFLALIGFGDVAVLAGGIATYAGPLESGPVVERKPPGPELRIVPNDAPDSAK